jgi:multidrug resistance protein EbrA
LDFNERNIIIFLIHKRLGWNIGCTFRIIDVGPITRGIIMNGFILLFISIISEVFGSSMLKAANGFKKLLPSLGVVIGYSFAFYGISLSLKTIPLGITYAIWSGLGTVLTAIVGILIYKETFTSKKFWGFLFIIGGVVLLNLSNGGSH